MPPTYSEPASRKRLIYVAGKALETAVGLVDPVLDAFNDDNAAGNADGLTGERIVAATDPIAVLTDSLTSTFRAGEQPVIVVEGHGSNNSMAGTHTINLAQDALPRATVPYISQIITAYVDTWHTTGHTGNPPKLLLGIASCYSEGVLKDIPPNLLQYADIMVEDSQQKVTWQDDSNRFAESLAKSSSAEEAYVRRQLNTNNDSNVYSIPALMTEQGVLDGDDFRNRVTPENFVTRQAAALAWAAESTLPEELKAAFQEKLSALSVETFQESGNENVTALLGYASTPPDQRFASLDSYRDDSQAMRTFLSNGGSEVESLQALRTLDANSRNITAELLFEKIDFTWPQEIITAKINALLQSGVDFSSTGYDITQHIVQDQFTLELIHSAMMSLPDGKAQWQKMINARDDSGNTVLLNNLLPYSENNEILERLIDFGVDINARDKDGNTLLHSMVAQSEATTIMPLLELGADIEAKNDNGETPLMLARTTIIAQLLVGKGADPNARNEFGQTVLFNTSSYALADFFIGLGVDPKATSTDGRNALMAASDGAVAKLLLDHGVDINATDNKGWNALVHQTFVHKNQRIAELLITRGIDIEAKSTDDEGATVLMHIARADMTKTADLLLDRGVDTETRDKMGKTALMYAARFDHREMVQVLIDRGADVNAHDVNGKTPLMESVSEYADYILTARLLIEQGADIHAKDNAGQTFTDYLQANTTFLPHQKEDLLAFAEDAATLQTTVETMLADHGNRSLIEKHKKAFDSNKDGTASLAEIAGVFIQAGITADQCDSTPEFSSAVARAVKSVVVPTKPSPSL